MLLMIRMSEPTYDIIVNQPPKNTQDLIKDKFTSNFTSSANPSTRHSFTKDSFQTWSTTYMPSSIKSNFTFLFMEFKQIHIFQIRYAVLHKTDLL